MKMKMTFNKIKNLNRIIECLNNINYILENKDKCTSELHKITKETHNFINNIKSKKYWIFNIDLNELYSYNIPEKNITKLKENLWKI